MLRFAFLCLALVVVAYGQAAPATPSAAPSTQTLPKLTNADIVALKQAGFGDDLIIQEIKVLGADYKLQADDLVELKKAGISGKVMASMIQASVGPLKPLDTTPTMQFALGTTVDELHSYNLSAQACYESSIVSPSPFIPLGW